MARSLEAGLLAGSLGSWAAGGGPLYAQLASAIQHAIGRGDLLPGARLPSERELSTALGVSRTTVVAAYDQLRATGALQSHRGSGTRVARREVSGETAAAMFVQDAAYTAPAPDLDAGPFAFAPPPDDIELTIGAMPGSGIVVEEIAALAAEGVADLVGTFGYLPLGLPALREAVAAHMTDLGVPSVADQVLITSGAQQAIDLLARHFGDPAASVIVENPTYPPAIDVFRASGAHLVPVPLDDLGVRIDLIRLNAQRVRAPLVYLNAICQNPTGTTLIDERRREIAKLAAELGLVVIDDLTSAYLADAWPLPTIGGYDRADRVITVGSLSKIAWGGLRIGWVRAPRALVQQLAARKVDVDFSTSLLSQAVAVRLLRRIDELIAAARTAARERLETLESALRVELPSWTWRHPSGGLCLWVRIPAGDAAAFTRVAAEHGVIVRPGPQFSADGANRDRLRLTYGHEPDVLREAVDRLAEAWADFRPTRARQGHVAVTV